jgi:hypothetical protein
MKLPTSVNSGVFMPTVSDVRFGLSLVGDQEIVGDGELSGHAQLYALSARVS